MDSDPILTYAPRRHDGRLGIYQWPAGNPVAYDPDDGPGDVCGNCASDFEKKGSTFRAWGAVTSRFYFRCKGCEHSVFHACTDHLSFPIPGFAAADGEEDRIRIHLVDRRLFRVPLDSDQEGKYRFFVPCHLVYPYFASLTEKGIGPDSPFFEQAMDAIDLHSWLRTVIDRLSPRPKPATSTPPSAPFDNCGFSSHGTSRRPPASRCFLRRPGERPRRRGSGRASAERSTRRGIRKRRNLRGMGGC